MRSKAEKRKNDYKHAAKKRRILKDVYHEKGLVDNLKHQLHRLSKGKIHCSCPLCSIKTNRDGYSHSDLKKIAAAADQEIE